MKIRLLGRWLDVEDSPEAVSWQADTQTAVDTLNEIALELRVAAEEPALSLNALAAIRAVVHKFEAAHPDLLQRLTSGSSR